MKPGTLTSALSFFMLFVTLKAAAQDLQLNNTFIDREVTASPEIKSRLTTQRKLISDQKLGFLVGATEVSRVNMELLTGELEVPASEVKRLQGIYKNRILSAATTQAISRMLKVVCLASARTYDLRDHQSFPAVRYQRCGNCWAYCATGAIEFAAYRTRVLPGFHDLSEAFLVNCSGGGSCTGGYTYKVYEFLNNTRKKMRLETQFADNGEDRPCNLDLGPLSHVELMDWGIVDPSGDISRIPTVTQIKEAICRYGAISCSMQATRLFGDYAGGVFKQTPSNYADPSTNHAVVIIGWDDSKNAWLVRNSWGVYWGENGYAWVDYNTNNIGRRATWVVVKDEAQCNRKYEIKINLVKVTAPKVIDTDADEDLFGSLSVEKYTSEYNDLILGSLSMWSRTGRSYDPKDVTKARQDGFTNIGSQETLRSSISNTSLSASVITVEGVLKDKEIISDIKYTCRDCTAGAREISIARYMDQIDELEPGQKKTLRIGNDEFFEMNFYENNDPNSSHVKFMWSIEVKAL